MNRSKSFGFDGSDTIALKSSLTIDQDLNIVGPGPAKVLVARSTKKKTPAFRIFNVNSGAVRISGLSIFNGRALNPDGASDNLGGAILNFGTLTISNCVIAFNEARTENGGVGYGGGIFSVGPLAVIDSTISNNNVSGAGGGISTFHTSDLLVDRSTVSDNFAAVQGGGINFQGTFGHLRNSTLSGNWTSPDGAASALLLLTFGGEVAGLDVSACTIARNKGGTNAVVFASLSGSPFAQFIRMANNLVAENDAQNFARIGSPLLISIGHNLDTDGTSGFANGVNGDLAGTLASPIDARLGPLAFNGGPTRTHALLHGSPAVDAGASTDAAGAPLTTDQRGVPRPQGPASDIGAFENQAPTLTCPTLTTINCGGELRVTVSDPDGDALTLVWAVDGADVQTNFLAAAKPGESRSVVLNSIGSGAHVVTVRVSDGKAAVVTCTSSITVVDNKAPRIIKLKARPDELRPVNDQFVSVTIEAEVEDCSPTTCRIIAVRSNQPVGAEPDWIITGDLTVDLRAERSGRKQRQYTITVECVDSAGNAARKTVVVEVPGKKPGRD